MAFVLWLSTIHLTIDMHFCGNKMVSFSLFGKAENCYELAGITPPAKEYTKKASPFCSIGKKDCCTDQFLIIDANQTSIQNSTTWLFTPNIQYFIIAFIQVIYIDAIWIPAFDDFSFYDPPNRCIDIPIQFQSFLL